MNKTIELRTDGALLVNEFEGYRLGGNPHVPQKLILHCGPQVLRTEERSLLHARLLSLNNSLVASKSEIPSAYYIDRNGAIWRIAYINRNLQLNQVYRLPRDFNLSTSYPASLHILENDYALFAAPPGRLFLMKTIGTEWKVQSYLAPFEQDSNFTILDARYESETRLHCILQCIKQEDVHYNNIIEWMIISVVEDSWTIERYRTMRTRGPVTYCSLEIGCKAVYIAADRPIDFINVQREETPEIIIPKPTKYFWMQTAEDITLNVPFKASTSKPELKITGNKHINVSNKAVVFLKGNLHECIDPKLTTWEIKDNTVNVCLMKAKTGIWSQFLDNGDPEGEQIMDPEFLNEINERLKHLCSDTEVAPDCTPMFNAQQLEECDFSSEEEACLVRLDGDEAKITHQAFLSAHPWILNVQTDDSQSLAIGLRHDADTCIWQPYPAENGAWTVKHVGTLLAFGYVQSSKSQKKYTVCPPDLKYSIVCESNRHAFVYHQKCSQDQLRQRQPDGETRRVKIGKQQVLSFERDEEVFGIFPTNEILFILCENKVIAYDMSDDII